MILKNAGVNVNRDVPNQKIMIKIYFNNSNIELFHIKNYFKEYIKILSYENLSGMRSRSPKRRKGLSKMQKQGHQGREVLQDTGNEAVADLKLEKII